MNLTNKTRILLATLIFLTLYEIYFVGATFMAPVISGQTNLATTQLVEASNLYNEPYILQPVIPEILITSPSPDARYSIKDELSIDFSVNEISYNPEADIDGKKVANGEIFKCSELAIGKHTMTVKLVANSGQDILLSGAIFPSNNSKEVTFTVVPLVSIKDLIGDKEGMVRFYIEGLGVEDIYDKTVELVYHDKVNNTEVGLNSETGSSSIGDSDTDTIPELRVNFNKKWLKDILDANPYAEFTLTLELNDASSLNISSSDWESQDPSQLLVVGLKDGVAAISSIDVTGVATSEVSIRLKDELGNIITAEPLGVASNMSSNIWVSFSDKRIRMYNSCGEIQNISGTDWFWTVSSTPDGLDYDGANLRYCSSGTNKLYQISSSGAETDLGIVKRRISLDGVATDSLSVNYTTQEYEGYNPTAISGTYLSSSSLGKISKRDRTIGPNFLQTLPSAAPIWINEQDTAGPIVGVSEAVDNTIIYLSSTNGNIYKVRFVDKVASGVGVYRVITDIRKLTNVYSGKTIYFRENGFIGNREYIPGFWPGAPLIDNGYEKHHDNYRGYYTVTPPSTFIEAKVVHRAYFRSAVYRWYPTGTVQTLGLYAIYPTNYYIIDFPGDYSYDAPILGNLLFTSVYDAEAAPSEWEPKIHVKDIMGIIPNSSFKFVGRYSQEGQSFPEVPVEVNEPYPIGLASEGTVMNSITSNMGQFDSNSIPFAFLTDNGSLQILDQFTTSIPVPQGLAMGRLNLKVDLDTDIDNDGDIDEQDEPGEENLGGFICINEDDDNNNGKQDKLESATITNEDNLKEMIISVNPDIMAGKMKIKRSNRNITVWKAKDKGQNMRFLFNAGSQGQGGPLEKVWDLGNTDEREEFYTKVNNKSFWVEGYNPGTATLTLNYTPPTGDVVEDVIKLTAIKVELGFQNSKMTSPKIIDPLDPPKNVRIGIIQEDSVTFKAVLIPDVILPDNQYNWSGEISGMGPEILVTFNTTGNKTESLNVLGVTRRAKITVMNVPAPGEVTWMAFHPEYWISAPRLRDEALAWATSNETALGGGIYNGRTDAARHAYWNAIMTVEWNVTDAEGLATAHERTNLDRGDPHNESVMDLENNAVGRNLGSGSSTTRSALQNAIVSVLNAGNLTILDDLSNGNEIGLLKPSNQ